MCTGPHLGNPNGHPRASRSGPPSDRPGKINFCRGSGQHRLHPGGDDWNAKASPAFGAGNMRGGRSRRRSGRSRSRSHRHPGGDGGDDVVESAVAHVGVDLRVVAGRRRRRGGSSRPPSADSAPSRARRSGRPSRSAGSSIWMTRDAGRFQVGAPRRAAPARSAGRSRVARLVVAHERPVQDRHRPGQHALDRLVGQRLRVGAPVAPSSAPAARRRRR